MARLLIEKGYEDVWPLLGGYDAWQSRGYPVEPSSASAPPVASIAAVKSSA